jgi:hypothetical protein
MGRMDQTWPEDERPGCNPGRVEGTFTGIPTIAQDSQPVIDPVVVAAGTGVLVGVYKTKLP